MRALLRLYPRSWRERYGDEFALVLLATPPGPGPVLDVVRGALDAHVRALWPWPLVRLALLPGVWATVPHPHGVALAPRVLVRVGHRP